MSVTDERVNLISNIIHNKIKKKDVLKIIDEMKIKYGNKAFLVTYFDKKDKPWNADYYKKLKNLALCGASSEDFIVHLVSVRDNLKIKKFITIALASAALIIALIILFIIL